MTRTKTRYAETMVDVSEAALPGTGPLFMPRKAAEAFVGNAAGYPAYTRLEGRVYEGPRGERVELVPHPWYEGGYTVNEVGGRA